MDWHNQQQSRAQVRVTIGTMLDQGLPNAFTPEIYEAKTAAVFQHVFVSYRGAGVSIYGS